MDRRADQGVQEAPGGPDPVPDDLPGFTDGHGTPHVDLEGPLEPLPAEDDPEQEGADVEVDAPTEADAPLKEDAPAPDADAEGPEPDPADETLEADAPDPAQRPEATDGSGASGPMPVSQLHLSTACAPLDELLDGGLERDAITLVFGEGGSGKTNLALQCARQATAAGLRVAYVDTEGVSPQRLEQVFSGDPRADQDKILFFTPFTIAEQEQMVTKTALLRDVGLIVVDSINMHYRLHIDGKETEREASASLFKQLHHLTGHARKHRIPVLVTGQVYGGEDETQPFARRVMEHMVKALVRFQKKPDGGRKATVLKHRSIEDGRSARFRIGGHGLT